MVECACDAHTHPASPPMAAARSLSLKSATASSTGASAASRVLLPPPAPPAVAEAAADSWGDFFNGGG